MTNPLPTVLLTGFTPFDGDALNPSWQVVRTLDGKCIARHRVVSVELPTEFGAALPALRRALRAVRPRLAIAFGLAGGRAGISLERVAINVIDARIPDNAGAQPIDVPVLRSGPAAYFSTLPIKAMLAALQRSDIPAGISQSAGTYVCNQVFYALMHAARRQRVQAGFVHVPWLPGQATRHGAPGMPLAQMQAAAAIMVRVALTTTTDAHLGGGAVA